MDTPPPLSFPAILRNSGLTDRFAYLNVGHDQRQQSLAASIKPLKREYNEGKRWVRRHDNAHFTGNPYIVAATKGDYVVQPTQIKPTFPEPLPPYLRTSKVPPAMLPTRVPSSANAGRFSLSLKGMRRGLRKCGFRAESLVQDVEHSILRWLQAGGVLLNPDAGHNSNLDHDIARGTPIGKTETIFEVSRTPLQLVWFTDNDNFARYVVHCCARYHGIVSFSKDMSGRRYTYLLRPNVTRPDHRAPATVDTPPVTDIDQSSQPDPESDRGGLETDSDVEPISAPMSCPTVPAIEPHLDDETWSIIGESDSEAHESGSDAGFSHNISTLSLDMEGDAILDAIDNEKTPRAGRLPRQPASLRRRVWVQGTRSPSSPSRSPARQPLRRNPLRFEPPQSSHCHKSFYDYLFV